MYSGPSVICFPRRSGQLRAKYSPVFAIENLWVLLLLLLLCWVQYFPFNEFYFSIGFLVCYLYHRVSRRRTDQPSPRTVQMTDEVLHFSISATYSTRSLQNPVHPFIIFFFFRYLSLWTEDLQFRFGIVTRYLQAFVRSRSCTATDT